MKKLLLAPLILFALWSAYWVVGKNTLMGALVDAKTNLSEDGILLSTADINVKGFPLSYQAALNDVDLQGPSGRYQAELISIKASALKPTVWTLSADAPVRVKMQGNNGQPYDFILAGEDMRVELGSSIAGKLKSVHVTMKQLKAVAAPGGFAPPVIAIDAGEISVSPSSAPLKGGMSANFDIAGLRLGDGAGGDLQRAFGPYISRVEGTALAQGLASLEVEDVAIWQAAGALTVPDFAMSWGKVGFVGDVDLAMSPMGANGQAALGISNAAAMIEALVEAGMLTQGQAVAGSFLLMAASKDSQGRTVMSFPVQNNALTLFGQTLHNF